MSHLLCTDVICCDKTLTPALRWTDAKTITEPLFCHSAVAFVDHLQPNDTFLKAFFSVPAVFQWGSG